MRILFLTLLVLNILCLPAMAYIDPGMFSLFLTYIVSGIVGAYIVFKNQIKLIFKKIKNLKNKDKNKIN
tara:strand:- start:289 stop:495 length:207 start_codon:yes stop_codon:yes gene_type:complete